MVVVHHQISSGARIITDKNVVHLPSQINQDIMVEENVTMSAKAILTCRPNSHHFQERTLTLDQPVKVGRSVARAKPTAVNAIFDCKDTKSSNGTFVNNKRLSTESYEVSSGDIVQFGVDVVENNKKVTHGCIIATLRLYLPDSREGKASPSIGEEDRHGVPLDDLYKLNQIIQEANQREQCLESKLNALQHIVEETKKSAEESWQAYVGEERLLSRLSALETQLEQARSNWSEDRLKEEIAKLRDNNEDYQEAAKNALERVHAEKLQAVALAMEQERAKISAEQDALLAKEQLETAQLELQEVAQKLTEIQTKAEKEKQEHEKQIRELEQHMEEEEAKVIELETKIHELTLEISTKHIFGENIQQCPELILENMFKSKEEILAENDIITEELLNKSNSNGFESNHISLTVAPVEEKCEQEKTEDLECEIAAKNDSEESQVINMKDGKRVSFKLPEENQNIENIEESSQNGPQSPEAGESEDLDKSNFDSDHVDSKTLKYQYQSAQREKHELRRKIDILEKISETNRTKIAELDKALSEERELSGQRLTENESLRRELLVLEQNWKDSCNENQELKQKFTSLLNELEQKKDEVNKMEQKFGGTCESKDTSKILTGENIEGSNITKKEEKDENELKAKLKQDVLEPAKIEELDGSGKFSDQSSIISNSSVVSCEQLMNLEEELVLLKEKYAQSCDEKVKLQRDLLKMKVQYEMVCNKMYNKYFFYIFPLLVVIYLLFHTWIS